MSIVFQISLSALLFFFFIMTIGVSVTYAFPKN